MYFFVNSKLSHSEMAVILSKFGSTQQSWMVFLSSQLFATPLRKGLDMKIHQNMWVFFRVMTWFVQACFRKVGVPKDKRSLDTLFEHLY